MNKIIVFTSLIKNELIKFFTKKIMFYVFIIITIGVFGFALNLKSTVESVDTDNWRPYLQKTITQINDRLNDPGIGMNDEMRISLIQKVEISKYMLDNNIPPIPKKSSSNFILSLNNLFVLVVILGIIASGKIMADEYTKGTINLFVTQPLKRWKLLLSKILALGVLCITIVTMLYIISVVIGWIFFGFDSFSDKMVSCVDDAIVVRNVFVQSFVMNLYNVVTLIACTSLTLFLTILLKNGIVSTCCSIILYYAGSQITFALREYSFIKYSLFANIHFQMHLNGVKIIKEISQEFSLVVIAIYVAIFYFLSFSIFNRGNVYE